MVLIMMYNIIRDGGNMKQTRDLSDLNKLSQIEEILGLKSSKTVVGRIEKKIQEYIEDFNDEVNGNVFSELMDFCGLEHEDLFYNATVDRDELWASFKNNQYELYYDEVETFISVIEDYFRSRRLTRNNIVKLQDLLEE